MTLPRPFVSLVLGMSLFVGLSGKIQAATPDNAPKELQNLIRQIETAANQKDIEKVMGFFSPNFTTSDGLTRPTLEEGLSQLWERYPNLQYTTQLQSWKQDGNQWIAETLTRIVGTGSIDGREMQLQATLKSRQYFQKGQLIRQEILEERTDITSGELPPKVKVNLPLRVKKGQSFDFDVIVQDPLGDNLLAGMAIDEITQQEAYLAPNPIELQLLQSGGLFKRATAPNIPESHWLSALLIQPGGMRLITQRLVITP